MRRIDIIKASHKVIQALDIIESVIRPEQDKANINLLNGFRRFNEVYSTFGEIEIEMLDKLGLKKIVTTEFWSQFSSGLSNEETRSRDRTFRSVLMKLHNVNSFLYSFLDLLKQDNINYTNVNGGEVNLDSEYDNNLILTVILPEQDGETSHPDRLVKVLESVNDFYEVYAEVSQSDKNNLTVVAIDSGSDKSFDFLGLASLITGIKEIIICLWDRVVFYRERKHSERLDLIAQSLPILEKIKELESSKAIGMEQAGIYRKKIIDATHKFINAGAIIPEMENHSTYAPKQLMKPEPKLISSPHNNPDTNEMDSIEEQADISLEDMSPEEKDEFIRKTLENNNDKNNEDVD